MRPLIRRGDLLTVGPASEVSLGDVLLVEGTDGRWVCHRLVEATVDTVTLRGDALLRPDRPLARDAVIGRVLAVTRDGRVRPIGGVVGRLTRTAAAASICGRPVLPRLLEMHAWARRRLLRS